MSILTVIKRKKYQTVSITFRYKTCSKLRLGEVAVTGRSAQGRLSDTVSINRQPTALNSSFNRRHQRYLLVGCPIERLRLESKLIYRRRDRLQLARPNYISTFHSRHSLHVKTYIHTARALSPKR
jgi:hypothetical protein